MLGCDTVRLSTPGGTMFLVMGFRRNTRDDAGQWRDEHGRPADFDYVAEQTVASGETPEQLLASVEEYLEHLSMSPREHLEKILLLAQGAGQ